MGRLKGAWDWLLAKDLALNFDQRLQRWVNVAAAVGVVVTVVGWIVGWILDIPWSAGLLIGLVAWVVILNLFVAHGRRSQLGTSSEPTVQEQERFEAELQQSERERDHLVTALQRSEERYEALRAQKDALEKELEEARSADKTGESTLEGEDPLVVINRLIAERDALKEELAQTLAHQESQPSDEELRQQSLDLSKELFQFLDERGQEDPQRTAPLVDATDEEINVRSQEMIRHDQETMRLYKRQFGGKVMASFEKLKRRGWWNPENLEAEERERFEAPVHSSDIERIAQRLNAIGHGL